jgi:cell division septation protein DedD
MFFNFNLQELADWSSSFDAAAFEKELSSIAGIATVAAVNSPAVVDAPKGTAPSTAAVQTVVNQVVEAVAPVVAPRVNPAILSKLEKITADEVVANPQVKASDAGVTVSSNVVNNIASSISSSFKNDAQQDRDLNAAIKEAAQQPGTTATTTAKPDAVNLPFDTTKPVTSQTMPFDTTKPVTAAPMTSATATTTTPTTAAAVQTGGTFTGEGYQNKYKKDPLLLDGKAFTGTRNGIEYKDGYPVTATRADVLEANRLADEAAEVAKRAATNPLYNPNMRPEGNIDKGFIVYWSWVGGATSGEWRQYRAPITPENMAKYGSRVFSGDTQQSGASAVGSNTLEQQPMPTYDKDGNITGYTLGGRTFTSSGFTGATTTTPTTTTPTTTTPTTTTPTTTTPTTTTPTTTKPTTTTPTTTTVTTTPTTTAVTTRPTTTATTTTPTTTTPTTTATTATPVFDINRQSAIKAMQDRFAKYGLASLANKILELAQEGATEATITLQLQETPEYQQRFRANQERLKKGLTVLTPAEYLNLEDGYRQVLRAYGLRQFDNDAYVQQFISNDVSPAELSNRVVTAVQRVQNADPQIARTLRDYYGIGQADLVAYVLDPEQQFQKIERQVAAAEIGTAARLQGIEPGVGTAEALAAQGITQAEARRGYSTIADILPTAEKLSQIYGGVEQAYGLAEAEQEVFNSLAEAQRRRQRLASREAAQFGGTSGVSRVGLTQPTRGQF